MTRPPSPRPLLLATAGTILLAAMPAHAQFFERIATYPVYENLAVGGEGIDPATQTVAEIVTASDDGMTLIATDSPGEALGFIDITDPAAPRGAGRLALGGEPTSVSAHGPFAYAGVNTSESYTEPSGHVAVVRLDDRAITQRCDVSGQPDSVAVSPDGAYLAVAVENERDEDLGDGGLPQLPAGHVAVFDLSGDGIANCDAVRIVVLTSLADLAPEDPEPEFVAINGDNVAVVTLQENNHLVLVDLASGAVAGSFSAGTVDLDGIDTEDDGLIRAVAGLADLPREPDGVAWIDTERFVTANEGDWLGGSRGFTIFGTDGAVLYDAGNGFDQLAMRIGHYPEGRSDNKGAEPEGATVATFGEDRLIFVNSERGNFVAAYRDTGADPEFLQVLPTAIGPEGTLALPERDLFVVATEEDEAEDGIRATVSIYARTAEEAPYPTLVSADDPETGAPIGWGALSGLAADPEDAGTLYAVSDSAYAASRIYTIDTTSTPAEITGYVDLMLDGEPAGYGPRRHRDARWRRVLDRVRGQRRQPPQHAGRRSRRRHGRGRGPAARGG